MKIKPLIIALGSLALVGIFCTSAFLSYAQTDENTSIVKADVSDYEEILVPYQNVFDEFNSNHNTTYGFMTEEQLSAHNINREEYLKKMVDKYSNMTLEEFEYFLEKAYMNDKGISAENLPYYHEETDEEAVIVSIDSDKNLVCPLNID